MSILFKTSSFPFPQFFFLLYKSHTNYGVKKGFLTPRNSLTKHVKKYHIFSRVFVIANQQLTRHSPCAPLGQVK